MNGKATERQRKYLGYLSGKGKEKFGENFSIREIAKEKGISWEDMSQEEASKLIEEVKAMVETDFMVDDKTFFKEVTEAVQKEEKQEATQPQASPTPQVYMIQLFVAPDKLKALEIVLEAMEIGYIIFKEVRA
ncbi:MAG: hypothetical protein QXE51_04715 [Nitrososphaeria archaeon]